MRVRPDRRLQVRRIVRVRCVPEQSNEWSSSEHHLLWASSAITARVQPCIGQHLLSKHAHLLPSEMNGNEEHRLNYVADFRDSEPLGFQAIQTLQTVTKLLRFLTATIPNRYNPELLRTVNIPKPLAFRTVRRTSPKLSNLKQNWLPNLHIKNFNFLLKLKRFGHRQSQKQF